MIPYKLVSRQECDIADIHSIESAVDMYKPWSVINAAAMCEWMMRKKNKGSVFVKTIRARLTFLK
jgi:dTDP-4-dehydrorhamnose reductase